MHASENIAEKAIGYPIENFAILGGYSDPEGRRVAVEMQVKVQSIGEFTLNILTTREAYRLKRLAEWEDLENPNRVKRQDIFGKQPKPYQLNDDDMTDEVLEEKFKDRIVRLDLSKALDFVEPEDSEPTSESE